MSTDPAQFLTALADQHKQQELFALGGPYKGGDITRLNKTWQPSFYSPDDAAYEARDLATRRLLDLGRNDPVAIALTRTLVDHCVGSGIVTTANVIVDGELIEDFNSESDERFEQWCEESDAEGRLTWPDQQRQMFREMVDVGEVFVLECVDPDPDRLIPLCYQVLPAEQLDSSKDEPAGRGGNEIRRGIEIDRAGRAVAYWLFGANPHDSHSLETDSTRVPAHRVQHVILPGRPGQTRAIGLHASIMQSVRDLDNYLGSELTSATIASLLSVVHKTKTPGNGMGFVGDGSGSDSDEYGNPTVKLARGVVSQIPLTDSIDVVDTKRPNSQADTFVRLLLLLTGMGGNVSRYRLTRDYTGTTYVAARAAHLDDRAAFRPLQNCFGRQICLPVRRRVTTELVAYGQLSTVSAAQFRRQRRRWQQVSLQPPGWQQIDELKETDAAIARIASGLSTLEEECAGRGRNWRKNILQRKREITFAAENDVPLNFDRPSQPAEPASQPEPEEEAAK